jgi:hypothetical protein
LGWQRFRIFEQQRIGALVVRAIGSRSFCAGFARLLRPPALIESAALVKWLRLAEPFLFSLINGNE